MILDVIFTTLGIFIFLFLFWRKLKEDYIYPFIFNTAFYSLFGLLIFNIFSFYFAQMWWFWFSLMGLFLGFLLGVVRFKLRFFEVLEALVYAYLPWVGLYLVNELIEAKNITAGVGAIGIILLLILFNYFDNHYKKFTWYRSGRIGFTGLTILGLFFLLRAVVAVYFPSMVSFVGKEDIYISGIVAFLSFLSVFTLSRERT